MAFKLDLSKFRKTAHDDDSTTLRHYEGHEIRVSHKKLSKAMREQLHALPTAMAKGGEVKKQPDSKWNPDEWMESKKSKKMADGGEVADQAPVTVNVQQPQVGAEAINPQAGMNSNIAQQPQINQVDPKSIAPDQFGVNPEQYAKDYEANKIKTGLNQAVDNAVQTPPRQPAAQQQAPQDPYGTAAYSDSLMKGVQEQKSGILGEASAIRQQAIADQLALQKQAEAQQHNVEAYQSNFKELEDHRKGLSQAIQDQHIDPNHYMNSLGVGGKILTAVGLVLGGIGGGHGPNVGQQALDSLIDRDINAQKAELGKKENLLAANMKQYGNIREAADVTRIQMSDITANLLRQNAAKSSDPMAQARAQQAIGELDQKVAPLMAQMALKKTIAQTAASGQGDTSQLISQLRVMNPEMAKEMESRYVPQMGMSQIPLTAEVRSSLLAKQQLGTALKELQDWSTKHSGSVDPATVNYGATKAAEIQSMYRNAINGGVFKKGEQEFIDNIIDSDPTKFFNSIRVAPKIKAVQETNESQLNSLKRSVGLPVQDMAANLNPQQQSYLQWAKANPSNPKAQAVMKKLGL